MQILVVEDDYDIAALTAGALEQAGYGSDLCRTVEDARQALRSQPYDLALIDMYLPDGTGLDLLTYLRAMHPEMPVIMLSARLDLSLRLQGGQATSYLRKPLAVNELLSRVRGMLAGRPLESAI